MDEIAKRRAELKQDCTEWTALDAAEDLVRAIKAGEINPKELIIHFFEPKEDGGSKHGFQCAGVKVTTHIALLNVALKSVIEDWME